MGYELEHQLAGKTLDDIRHALPCSHPIQIELDKLEQVHRDATEEVAKAHKRGWEQGKRECENIANNLFKYESGYYHYREDVGDAIAAMEYGGKAND